MTRFVCAGIALLAMNCNTLSTLKTGPELEKQVIEAALDYPSKDSLRVIRAETSVGMLILNSSYDDFAHGLIEQARSRTLVERDPPTGAFKIGSDPKVVEAAEDFCAKNRQPFDVAGFGEFSFPFKLLSADESRKIFADDIEKGWAAFYAKYPHSGGILTLSRPGFSRDRTVSMICIDHIFGGLAGGGRIRVFKLNGGKWEDPAITIGPIWNY